ncbi:hypothetical protein Tco_0002202 [Tanacetum coccineum]
MVVQDQAEIGEGSANHTDPHHTPTFIQPSTSQPQKKQKPRKAKRKDTQIPQSSGPTEHVSDEAVYKELDDSLVRAATTTSSLEAEYNSGNIAKTQSKATPNESSSLRNTSGGGPRRQETMGILLLKLGRMEWGGASIGTSWFYYSGILQGGSGEQNKKFATKDLNLTVVMKVTLAQALAVLKSVKSKVKGDVIEEPSVLVSAISTKVNVVTTTTTTLISTTRKGIVVTKLEIAEVDDDQEATKIKELMKIIPDEEEVAIDSIPLATKPPTIVDWKIHKEGKKNYYQFTDNSWKLVKKLNRINKTSGGL